MSEKTPTESIEPASSREISSQDYDALIQDLSNTVKGGTEGLVVAWEEYVVNEPNPQMATFAAVMLRASTVSENKRTLSEYQKNHTALNLEQREYMQTLKKEVIADNHYLRDMIADQRDIFTQKQVSSWYGSMMGEPGTAESMISGAYAEIAVGEVAASMPDVLQGVRYGDIEEDAKGMDMLGRYALDGKPVAIDAKAGLGLPACHLDSRGMYRLTINVPTNALDSHGRLDEEGRNGLKRAIHLSLMQESGKRAA